MADRRKTDPDELLKAYYRIMRGLGPDPVLEQRIRNAEHGLAKRRVKVRRPVMAQKAS